MSFFLLILSVGLVGCAGEESDPLAVTSSAMVSEIEDNTGTGYYLVESAQLQTNALGTELTLGFSILDPNGMKFDPVSTITFADGTVLQCKTNDLRRMPSLVSSTTSWSFPCDAASFPVDSAGASLVVVDEHN